ncbi:MAG: L,D-transpeptidase family protein [Thermodesulfobacteriota bacterium]
MSTELCLAAEGEADFRTFFRDQQFFQPILFKEPLHLILVEKNRQLLSVMEYRESNLRIVNRFFCTTGENRGQKKRSGDSRTPDGIYFVNKIYKDNKVTVFGKNALHLDYPNFYDLKAGRDGDGIYIHGTNKGLVPFSTNGCITLQNSDLEELVSLLHTDLTPVLIVPSLKDLENTESLRPGKNLVARARSLVMPEHLNKERVEFTSLYILHYRSHIVVVGSFIHNRENFSQMMEGYSRSYLGLDREKGLVRLKNIQYSEPMHFKIALRSPEPVKISSTAVPGRAQAQSSAIKKVSSQTGETSSVPTGVQEQDAVRKDKGRREITAEARPSEREERRKKAVSDGTAGYPRDRQQITDFVEIWRQAWQNKDLDTYIASYVEDFSRGNKDLAAYRKHKKRLNRIYDYIKVKIDDLKVTWTREGASVSFRQVYDSDRYHAVGRKILKLAYINQEWKIKRELWISEE